jgi:hypothetical protein
MVLSVLVKSSSWLLDLDIILLYGGSMILLQGMSPS